MTAGHSLDDMMAGRRVCRDKHSLIDEEMRRWNNRKNHHLPEREEGVREEGKRIGSIYRQSHISFSFEMAGSALIPLDGRREALIMNSSLETSIFFPLLFSLFTLCTLFYFLFVFRFLSLVTHLISSHVWSTSCSGAGTTSCKHSLLLL